MESDYLTAFWTNVHIVRNQGWVGHTDLLLYWATRNTYRSSFFASGLAYAGARGDFRAGDDIYNYVTRLQDRFDRFRPQDRTTIATRLQTAYAWNFVDPTLLYALYALYVLYGTFVGYLWKEESYSRMPLPKVGNTTFYPETRFNLSPFGAEHYLDVLFGRDGAVLDVYGRIGSSGLASYSGVGARLVGAQVTKRVFVGGELDVWNQPEIASDARGYYDRENRFGWNAGARVVIFLVDRVAVSGTARLQNRGLRHGTTARSRPPRLRRSHDHAVICRADRGRVGERWTGSSSTNPVRARYREACPNPRPAALPTASSSSSIVRTISLLPRSRHIFVPSARARRCTPKGEGSPSFIPT